MSPADESLEQRRRRASTLLRRLRAHYEARCGLQHESPFQLLVATILSAQCSDEMVNRVTPALFARCPSAESLAAISQAELEGLIGSLGLFRNKAKNLRACGALLVSEFGGQPPRTMAELTRLPGVARKTANVVLGTAYGIAVGVVVDTHVARLSGRLGLSAAGDPVKIERDLMAVLPRNRWIEAGHNLVWHGRKCCSAQRPACDRCPVADLCPRLGL
jgi:endonuclease-3